jgi:hypothetical protein
MQWFVFLWFQLQMTKQYLQEKTSGPAQSPADSANLNTPIHTGTARTHPSSKDHQPRRR